MQRINQNLKAIPSFTCSLVLLPSWATMEWDLLAFRPVLDDVLMNGNSADGGAYSFDDRQKKNKKKKKKLVVSWEPSAFRSILSVHHNKSAG